MVNSSATRRDDAGFGRTAADLGLLREEDLREAVEIRGRLAELGVLPREIREICLEKGFLTREQADRVDRHLREGAHWPRIPGFRIIENLGRGGMGTVYKAHQQSLDRVVAIKVLAPRFEKDPVFIDRFIREAKAVARLNDPNIIGGIDVGEVDGRHYFIMEYVEGETASHRVERVGPLPEHEVISIGIQMAKALQHAAEVGLVHRDIKPHNILITPKGVAKLCDLGLAKVGTGAAEGTEARALGTPYYISPEQARGPARVDIRSDIYSLGATLFHLATGTPPFDGPSPMVIMTKQMTQEPPRLRTRNPRNSAALDRVILKMMAKAKADRYGSPEDLLDDLRRIEGRVPPRARGGRGRRRPARRLAGRARARDPGTSIALPLMIAVGAALLVLGVVILGPDVASSRPAPAEWSAEADRLLKDVMEKNLEEPGEPVELKVRRLEEVVRIHPRSEAARRARELITRYREDR